MGEAPRLRYVRRALAWYWEEGANTAAKVQQVGEDQAAAAAVPNMDASTQNFRWHTHSSVYVQIHDHRVVPEAWSLDDLVEDTTLGWVEHSWGIHVEAVGRGDVRACTQAAVEAAPAVVMQAHEALDTDWAHR